VAVSLDEPRLATPRGIHPLPITLHVSKRTLTLLTILWVGPWLMVAILAFWPSHRRAGPAANLPLPTASADEFPQGKPGTWGRLAYVPLTIELPDEFVSVPSAAQPPIRWFFEGYTKPQAVAFLRSSGLKPEQADALAAATWKSDDKGGAVEPGDELIVSLSPEARGKIYSLLVEFPENGKQIDPVWFREGQIDERLKQSGLAAASIELLKSLMYRQGDKLLLFADLEPALRRLGDDQERRRFLKAVLRKDTLLLRLRIDANSKVEEMASYWGLGGRRKNLLPLFRALQRSEKSHWLSVITVLPDFPSDHLYSYPLISADPAAIKQDCFWSSLNFFNTATDDHFNDMNYVHEVLKREYQNILEPSQLGDLVFVATPNDTVVHAAAYLADDVVFTKNGESYTQPWILMHMADMLDTYTVHHPKSGPLKTLYFRRKAL
jgi:hypothetical protein